MRVPLTVAILAASISAFAQLSGTFQPSHGTPAAWSIDVHHNLIWNGQPYVPEGIRIEGTPDEVKRARSEGFQDVIVNVPPNGAGWRDVLSALEGSGMRYILSIDSLLPPARGVSVEPEAYRVEGITADRHVEFPLPGATSALAVLVTQQDASIQSYKRIPVVDGKFVYDVKAMTDLDELLLIYPEQSVATHPDYWDGFDAQRDDLLAALEENKPGPGLRAILNPLGRMFSTDVAAGLFVPDSPFFRDEMASYLEGKYRNLQTAERAWALSANDLETFSDLAKLVPLWSGPRGVSEVWDTASDNLIVCESKHSAIWTDIKTVMATAAAKRFERLVPAVQSVADVPVLQEWTGWAPPFEAANPELSGIGYSTYGPTAQDLINGASRPTSSLLRWNKPGWLVCTQLNMDKSTAGLSDVLNDLESMGTRGWFLSSPDAQTTRAAAADSLHRSSDSEMANASMNPFYFPENAFNPVLPKRLPGGRWWLPSPEDGNRIDYGAGFFGYQYFDGINYTTVLWTTNPPARFKLHLSDPKKASILREDNLDPKPKLQKDGIELYLDSTPTSITTPGEVPVPDQSMVELSTRFAQLLSFGQQFHVDVSEEGFYFQDALTAFKHDPSASFVAMRQKFWLLDEKVGRFSWIEGEAPKKTNFSEILPLSGCSNENALVLHTPVTTDPNGFFANYEVPTRSDQDQEVWIAAKIPPELIKDVTVEVSNQILSITEGPISPYSTGFAWYKLGITKLAGSGTGLSLRVNSPEGAYLSIDVILLFPGHFSPNGIAPPDALNFMKMPTDKKKKGGGGGGGILGTLQQILH